ncbi:hypothetical protein DFJ67_0516 [Asanoa ferruginea]|uniref:LPXTG-motif cell wall-anchored protein n=2 Tax=Asanoa ferruginea TaxID=53367 RepID=A0A3D9ZAZ5_9ACTN|nr:hypothetical protein DFJ67_0516 [Asanoa ferruginea]GIF50765.1 hypothetical protein Afe04nite_53040 [Asanoa ferruginea]
MGKLRTRVGLGAAVIGLGLALGAPAFADGGSFRINSPQSGSTISSTPTIQGMGRPGARVAVEAINQNQQHRDSYGPQGNGPQGNGPQGNAPQGNGPQGNYPQGNNQGNEAAGTCNTTVAQNGFWSCTISPALRSGRYRVIARQSLPGADNEVASVDNLLVPGGNLPVTPGPDPVPVVAGGLVLLAGGAVVVAMTRARRRARHAA